MSHWQNIKYHAFWDQPRTFHTLDGEKTFLFDCQFDEQLDDYPACYNVYLISSLELSDMPALWVRLEQKELHLLGTVKISQSAFDPSHWKQIDLDILNHLIPVGHS